jgi:hypothetical protein
MFSELRMRTIKEINQSADQATIALLRRDSKELMAQQGRPSTRADLTDFLIKPVQRICRYPLLLKEIIRLTSEGDSEYRYIDRTYGLMKKMAHQMDETQRVVERKLLTEQFLKKLPESSFPRRVGGHSTKDHAAVNGNNDGGNYSASWSGSTSNSNFNLYSQHHHHHTFGFHRESVTAALHSPSGNGFFDFSPIQGGISPSALTKAFTGTLGSIVLAGALEYVILPDMPLSMKYHGCFLFETMLIITKAKKSTVFEPRQWLPLRLCELQETTRPDGM